MQRVCVDELLLLSMMRNYRLFSTMLLCLPLVSVALLWEHLPERLPVHFDVEGQPDRFAPRQEWFNNLTSIMFVLVLIRTIAIGLLSKRWEVQETRFIRTYILSAALVSSALELIVFEAVYQSPLSTDFLPVLMALFGAGFVYWTIPPQLPATNEPPEQSHSSQRVAAVQQMHILSRLVVVRVNLLAALLMLVARSHDRWTIGIAANVLAFIALTAVAIFRRQSS